MRLPTLFISNVFLKVFTFLTAHLFFSGNNNLASPLKDTTWYSFTPLIAVLCVAIIPTDLAKKAISSANFSEASVNSKLPPFAAPEQSMIAASSSRLSSTLAFCFSIIF